MFLLFAGDQYYPLGGWKDLKGVFATLELAQEAASKIQSQYDWWHISDGQKLVIVENY